MRRAAVILVALGVLALLYGGEAKADCPDTGTLAPFAFETLTVSTTALGFSAATFAPSGDQVATVAIATVETNPLRFRADGLSPTSSVGHLVTAGQSMEVCGEEAIRKFRGIRQGAADSTVMVTYYR